MSEHRTYEALRDAMARRFLDLRNSAGKRERGVWCRMLFELAGFDVAGPRPLMYRVQTPTTDPSLELERLDASQAAVEKWERAVREAGVKEEDFS